LRTFSTADYTILWKLISAQNAIDRWQVTEKTEPSGEQQLVEAAQNCCVESFGALYQRYYNGIVALAYSTLADIDLAEDAAQESFAVACRELGRLKDMNRFGGWLGGICRNVSRQMMRKEKRHLELDQRRSTTAGNEHSGIGEAIRQAVWQLRPRDREPIVLRYYDNLSYEQIAGILRISQQAVNGRIIRAKQKIAARLRRNGFTGTGYEKA